MMSAEHRHTTTTQNEPSFGQSDGNLTASQRTVLSNYINRYHSSRNTQKLQKQGTKLDFQFAKQLDKLSDSQRQCFKNSPQLPITAQHPLHQHQAGTGSQFSINGFISADSKTRKQWIANKTIPYQTTSPSSSSLSADDKDTYFFKSHICQTHPNITARELAAKLKTCREKLLILHYEKREERVSQGGESKEDVERFMQLEMDVEWPEVYVWQREYSERELDGLRWGALGDC
ncbi:unnamed protein product [Ambrosiozyma monospora]|uniref:Unnamed protein product n=1 Tax=Ambrosiozyma monospora TaxID=43982 RepID=A0ACB5TA53_AMBMO|nr:unnamed protein product [Ambrosiozyma monospora]